MSTLIRLRKKKDEFSGQGVNQHEESEELCSDDGKVRLLLGQLILILTKSVPNVLFFYYYTLFTNKSSEFYIFRWLSIIISIIKAVTFFLKENIKKAFYS